MKQENEILVEVENVSKKFCKKLKLSLWYGLQDIIRKSLGLPISSKLRKDEFWAVNNVSFKVRRGECVGLIGHNGAGKSSLLKVLNGLYTPDKGKITMKGRVGALIELGAGFNPILTGKENIYNNAAILGFTKQEVDEKMQEIIDFSEIGEFLDTPVKNYSSGMKVRLGFAVAAYMNPDILLIDEVLAVGDLGFVIKCFKKIDQILPDTAVIFVSHNMPMISRMCSEIILMEHGNVEFQGTDVSKGIDLYYNRFSTDDQNIIFDSGDVKVSNVLLNGIPNETEINWGETLEFSFDIDIIKPKKTLYVFLMVMDKEQRPVAQFKSTLLNTEGKKELSVNFIHEKVQLSKGFYTINIKIDERKDTNPLLRINQMYKFTLVDNEDVWAPFSLESKLEVNEI